MGGGSKRNIKDIPLMIPKGLGGGGGRPEYDRLKRCPDSFRVDLELSNLTRQLKEEKKLLLSVISEKEIRVMAGSFLLGTLLEKQAKEIFYCIRLGIKYEGSFYRDEKGKKVEVYAKFKRVS